MRHRPGALIAAASLAVAPTAPATASAAEAPHSPSAPAAAIGRSPGPAPRSSDDAYRSSVTYTFTDPQDRNSAYQSVLVVESSRALSPAELRAINRWTPVPEPLDGLSE
jgi:hypothetical protein